MNPVSHERVTPRPVATAALVLACGLLAVLLIGIHPVIGGALVVVAIAGVVMFLNPLVGIFVCIAALVGGQLLRIPAFGSEGAMLPNDLLIPAVAAGWLWRGLLARRVQFVSSPLSWPLGTMFVVFVLTFIAGMLQLPFLTGHERLVSSMYLVRWAEYAMLFFVVADVVRTRNAGRSVLFSVLAAAVLVALLGFVQLKVFPDFSSMVPKGWDPHVGRLLSTWFDPNFAAGFFSFVAVIAAGIALHSSGRMRVALWTVAAVLFAGVVLTFSRSGYVAFIAGATVLTFLKSRRLFMLMVVVAGLVVMSVPRVQERVIGAFSIDETAKTRIVSWKNALSVVQDFPLTGIGYNAYRFVQVDYGFQKDAAEHSAGGSDSSLLTVLVTAGSVGLAVYLWLLWAYASVAWRAFRSGDSPLVRGLGLGALSAIASVAAHSFFINSLLYPHMMETIALTFGTLVGLTAKERAA